MQPLKGHSSSIIVQGTGILGDYPSNFDHIQRSSVAPRQRTNHPLKFVEIGSRQTALPFISRQNPSLDYRTEENCRTAVIPFSDPQSWPSGYSYDTSHVPEQNDEAYDEREESTQGYSRHAVNTLRLSNDADNQGLGIAKRLFEAFNPIPPPSIPLHPPPLHPPPYQHPYLHPLPHSLHQRHHPGLDDAFQVSMSRRKVENPFGTNHLQETKRRREVAKQGRPFSQEVRNRELRRPNGSCFREECFEENVEISLKKARRVLLPTPKSCSSSDPSSSTSSRAVSAPTTAAAAAGGGDWTNVTTSSTRDDTDAEIRGDDETTRIPGPSPSATQSSSRPHHHPIRPDAITVPPPLHQPSSASPLPPLPPPSQQQQHRQVMRTTALDESGSRPIGSREANGFFIGRSSNSISDDDDRQKDSYICHICRVRCHNLENFDVHMQSEDHRRLMKAIASVHLQKTKQRLKALKVNRKQRLRFNNNNNTNRRNHRFGVRSNWMTSPVTTAAVEPQTTKDGIKRKTTIHCTHAEKVQMNGAEKPGRDKPGSSCLPNKAKFLLECTFHRQNEDDVHPIWLASDRNGVRPNASQPRGQDCIVAVSGFLCKLCNKFYNDETTARVTHCSSRKHICKYREMLKMMKTFRGNSAAENASTGC